MKGQPDTFNAYHLSLAGAIGQYVVEPNMAVSEVLQKLETAGDAVPELNLERGYRKYSGNDLRAEIFEFAKGLYNLMEVAHTAGKAGQEII